MFKYKTEITKYIRDFLFIWVNKEFLIFIFFVIISSTYWLMSVLNDTMERDINVPVRIVGVPKNVIIIGDTLTELRVTVRDKGFVIANYIYGEQMGEVNFVFSTFAKSKEHLTITSADIIKQLQTVLSTSTKIVAIKPDHLDLEYNNGLHKKVPVRFSGLVKSDQGITLTKAVVSPDSVYVYATPAKLEGIKAIYTNRVSLTNNSDTSVQVVKLRPINGVKTLPTKVRVTLYTDIMTEASIDVPLTATNVPKGRTLRTFPAKVRVNYTVGASNYKDIKPEQFQIVADYNSTMDGTSDKCTIRIISYPRNIRNPQLQVDQVDYLIEH